MVSVYERWGAKVDWDVHRNMYFHRDKKSKGCYPCLCFLMLEDGGGKLDSVHMYIKSRRVTDQPLTAGTLTVYACKQEKGYRIFLRTQTLPHIAAQHGIQRMLCLAPATVSAACSYITMFLLPCFSPLLLLRPSIFWACAKSKDRRKGGKLTPKFGKHSSQGQNQIQTFWKAVHTEQVNASKWVPKEELVT